ncbi:MAG: tyrosine-type recombinase/integrase [Aeromicrobium sp.]
MVRRRGFGEVERRASGPGRVTYRARYAMPDGTRYSRTLGTKLDAEAWLAAERALVDREEWTPPKARQAAETKRQVEAAFNTVGGFAERYLVERDLRPTTVRHYRQLLATRVLPYFGEMPLVEVTLSDVKRWRASLDPATESTNAAAYRVLRSILQAAEEEELIDRAPPKIRGAGSARVKRVAKPATLDELGIIVDAMPERLKLLVVLAGFVGLRQGELLELRRSDVDGVTGRIDVTRKVDKDVFPGASDPCPHCGRGVGAPKTSSGIRTVHVPPPFLPMLQKHLLEHGAPGPDGLLFPGDRTDHMSVRYLMDRYRPAREAAGRPDLTVHHLRHTALTMAGQHGATAAELQARGGHSSQVAMAIYQHATLDRDKRLAEQIGDTYAAWAEQRSR